MTEFSEDVPEPSEQNDQIQPEDSLLDRGVDDVLDEGLLAGRELVRREGFGNTPEEREEGETIDQRLKQEEPEADQGYDDGEGADDGENVDDGEVGDQRAGRLVDPNSGLGEDVDSEMVGDDVGIDGAGASAEEAAVHVVRDRSWDEDLED